MSTNYRKISVCRVCGSDQLISILSLGEQYVSNFVDADTHMASKAPLELVLCDPKKDGCCLLQLAHTVNPSEMYEQYWYQSSINQTMRDALADIAAAVKEKVNIQSGEIILDIGCNDGTLLRSYQIPNAKLVGFDPAKNIASMAIPGTTRIFNDYFHAKPFVQEFGQDKARVITTIAMFYDLDDPNTFVNDIKQLLAPNGIWVIQMNFLPFMIQDNVFDNICHEHLDYYSMTSLEVLLKRHHLKIVDVTTNGINGGSFRAFIAHADSAEMFETNETRNRINHIRTIESEMHFNDPKTYFEFASRVKKIREQCVNFVKKEAAAGKKIYVYGASTKGNVVLQYFGLDHTTIIAAADRNPIKFGKKTIGTLIPIISEEDARKQEPDYFFVMPWFFLKEFISREHAFLERGGKFIAVIPEFRLIDLNGTNREIQRNASYSISPLGQLK